MKLKRLLFLALLSFFFSCSKVVPEINFYHWQTTFNLNESTIVTLSELAPKKTYIHVFDVDYGNHFGDLKEVSKNPFKGEIVPVVFILNNQFKNDTDKNLAKLVLNVSKRILSMHKYMTNKALKEIQIDCDWTESTKESYFKFLEKMQEYNKNIIISSTVRLHQLKDLKIMGIPPIKKGTLMVYNTGDLSDFKEKNSILNTEKVAQYISYLEDYPIPLDIALPLYSWAVIQTPYDTYSIVKDVSYKDFESGRFKKIGEHQFESLEYQEIRNSYLAKGSKIKLETVTKELLLETINLIKPNLNKNKFELQFYDVNHLNKEFTTSTILEFKKAFEE